MGRLIQIAFMAAQAAIVVWAYTAIRAANPDLAASAIAVAAVLIAFAATAILFAIYDLTLRLVAYLRRLGAQKQPRDVIRR